MAKITVDTDTLDLPSRTMMLAFTGDIDGVNVAFAEWWKTVESEETRVKVLKAAYVATRKMVVDSRPELAESIHNPNEGKGRPAGSTNKSDDEKSEDKSDEKAEASA